MKILLPLDKSTRDGIVLPYSAEAAQAYGASLELLTVVTIQRSIVPGIAKEAEAYLQAVAAGLMEQGVKQVEYAIRKGDAASVIVNHVEESACDMIVMASRGRGGLGKLMLGSVADAVLSTCGKPVLLLSEAANGPKTDETVRQQSAYLATVLWNKQAKGLITPIDVRKEIEVLAASGLDRQVLNSTYQALEEQGGIPFGWLDIDFQLRTLHSFLPDEVIAHGVATNEPLEDTLDLQKAA